MSAWWDVRVRKARRAYEMARLERLMAENADRLRELEQSKECPICKRITAGERS